MPKKESGMTIIEALIALAISMIFMASLTTLIIHAVYTLQRISKTTDLASALNNQVILFEISGKIMRRSQDGSVHFEKIGHIINAKNMKTKQMLSQLIYIDLQKVV